MSARKRVIADVSQLPDITFGIKSTPWWGTLGFMASELVTLVVCAFTMLYLRKNFSDFPPLATPLPSLTTPVIQLVVLGVSILPMWYAARAARALDMRKTRMALTLEIVFKIAILWIRWYEFKALNTWWNSDAYGSAVWLVLGIQTSLLVVDAAEDVGLCLILWSGKAETKHLSDVVDDAMYWYFTVATWIPLFVLVFLYPRWL